MIPWLKEYLFELSVIHEQFDPNAIGRRPTKIVQKNLHRFNLSNNYTTDVRVKIRKNKVVTIDSYFSVGYGKEEFVFYDIEPDKNVATLNSIRTSANIIFASLDVNLYEQEVVYERTVYTLLQVLSDLGGFKEIIFVIVSIFMAPVSALQFDTEMVTKLFLTRKRQRNERSTSSTRHVQADEESDSDNKQSKMQKWLRSQNMF